MKDERFKVSFMITSELLTSDLDLSNRKMPSVTISYAYKAIASYYKYKIPFFVVHLLDVYYNAFSIIGVYVLY